MGHTRTGGEALDVVESLRRALQDRYAIERELGQGGMATVYLAEDLRHRRKVALKVLRPEIAATVGAGRFAREIEVAARLQHPNILPLLDSGEAAGFFFYVMPYVEGESLRDRLARAGELPVPDAVRIVMEVADALGHAHAHGVVHRDIKPDNVMLLGRHAVVTDFGVAKAVTEATGRQLLTSAGVALGTPAYMAPEQATADAHQDHRVDIYALGVLAYELLTGRAPFSATTAQEMLAAHVTLAPEPIEKYRATVSPALAAIVMKCLAKKPADRWQSAEEVLAQLEPLATPSGGTTPTLTAPVAAARTRRRVALVAGGAGAIALAAAVAWAFDLLPVRPLGITASDITQVTSEPGAEIHPAISPDGRDVAYVAGTIGVIPRTRLAIRSTADVAGGGEVQPGDTARRFDGLPAWSPGGDFVRFSACLAGWVCTWRETGRLGGMVRPVALPPEAQERLVGGFPSWSPDGGRVAFVVRDTILVASAAGTGARRVAVHPEGYLALHSLAWSPNGKYLAYANGNLAWLVGANVAGSSIWVVDADGGEAPRRVTTDDHLSVSPVWLDVGHLLFVSDRDGPRGVYVVAVGPRGRRGEPRIVPGVADPHSISFSPGARKLAWAKLTVSQNVWSFPLGRSGPMSVRGGAAVTSGNQVVEEHDVSPDGRWLAFDSDRRGNMDLYRMPVGGGDAVAITADSADEFDPQWSPDGREIAFYTLRDVRVVPAEGGVPQVVADGGASVSHPRWSPNGLDIAFGSNRTGRTEAWIASRDTIGAAWRRPVRVTGGGCSPLDWMPDGSGILCASPDRRELFRVSREGRVLWRHDVGARGLRLHTGVPSAQFSRDGRTLYFAAYDPDRSAGIWAMPAAGGPARLVVVFDDPASASYGTLSVGRDRLFLTVSRFESDIWVANLQW